MSIPNPTTLAMKAVMMPTRAPTHQPAALPTVVTSSTGSPFTILLDEKARVPA